MVSARLASIMVRAATLLLSYPRMGEDHIREAFRTLKRKVVSAVLSNIPDVSRSLQFCRRAGISNVEESLSCI